MIDDLIDDNKRLHRVAYDTEMQKRQEIQEQRMKEQLAKEERMRIKQEEKKRKIELARRAKLRGTKYFSG